LLGTEAADAVEVESGHSEAEENGHLHLSEYPEKPSTEVDEGTLQGRIHGFNDLEGCKHTVRAPTSNDAPLPRS
jgi:hypothetical protein